ncbi:MAG: TIGR03936 family radical SAM-associated protein [Clostridiales Family XIII bacterium]|jgi:radical SAM-linked protein|nr:TIGR03936 family radical SAM-associated protein [Clostridiales Family XIII bacterium]
MRYLAKFEKKGMMIYVSHLDIQRLFQRAVKRAKLDLKYSGGYSPHPRLSFAQPLSLGHYSIAEYLEFETNGGHLHPGEIEGLFNRLLPAGVRIVDAWQLQEGGKSVSSLVAAAKYRIEIPFFFSYMEATMDFFGRESIDCDKLNRKTGRTESVNIRPLILSLKPLMVNDNRIVLISSLHCGSASNLNPEQMLKSFYRCSGHAYDRGAVRIERTSLLGWSDDELVPLEHVANRI